MRCTLLCLACGVVAAVLAWAETSVSVQQGNVYVTQDGNTRQLTRSGSDSDAAVSHDGQWIVFVRQAVDRSELWVASTGESDEPRMVSTARRAGDRFHSPRFSADGEIAIVVGETAAGIASISRVDLDTGYTHAIFPEVSRYAWIDSGPNAGKLLVAHKRTCSIEQSKYPCYPILLLSLGKTISGKRVDKDDANFDEVLARYSR